MIVTSERVQEDPPTGRRALYNGVSANCTHQLGEKEDSQVQKASPKPE